MIRLVENSLYIDMSELERFVQSYLVVEYDFFKKIDSELGMIVYEFEDTISNSSNSFVWILKNIDFFNRRSYSNDDILISRNPKTKKIHLHINSEVSILKYISLVQNFLKKSCKRIYIPQNSNKIKEKIKSQIYQ